MMTGIPPILPPVPLNNTMLLKAVFAICNMTIVSTVIIKWQCLQYKVFM